MHVFAVSRRQRFWRCLFGFSGVVWPLAGERKYRYDAIWVSSHFTVGSVEYVYDEAIEAGTDHALVLAGLLVGP